MSAEKRKGTSAESAVVEYLRDNGFPYAERRVLNGAKDKGDITGIPGLVVEVKNCVRLDLAAFMDEALKEQANDGASLGVLWHKRKRKGSPGDWYVTMTGAQFVTLLHEFLGTKAEA